MIMFVIGRKLSLSFDTLEEAKEAKAEHDKSWNEIKNRDVVDKVIEGAEN